MAGFQLSKWYADCISEEGDAVIIYHAELRWRRLAIHYSSLLFHRDGHPAESRFSLQKHTPPQSKDGEIDWPGVGCWRDIGDGVHELLYDSASGSVEWNCVAPRASASVQIEVREPVRGWGYAEHLLVSIAPWKMPIRRLRWGRFVNSTDAMVWIDWCGAYSKQVVYLNGKTVDAAAIGDREIVLASHGGVLTLDAGTVLRDGLLGATVLSMIPNLDRLFPKSLLQTRECKWLSRAMLRRPGRPDSAGMAIHEVVEWP
jgi:hypothetical protein